MAINIPTGTTEFGIEDSDQTYVLGKNSSRTVNDANGIFVGTSFSDNTIIIRGDITQTGVGFAGIWVDAEDTTINVEGGGSISGVTGILSENFEPSSRLDIRNDGLIEGEGFAIQTADSKEHVINHGTIHGKIDLGSGKDTFDNRGGTVDHKIGGGTGDDTLIVDRASTKLFENGGSAGYDTVKSTVSYTLSENVERLILLGNGNTNGTGNDDQSDLFGNSGNNKLMAKDGVDILDGGRGNDRLVGGDNADTFVFKTGYDHDTIADFENGIDHINLKNWNAISNFNDLKNNHLTVDGDNLIIHAGGDELVLLDTKKGELDNGDFTF
jgi:Ca2+-binding RTX toxin-like protein